MAIVKRRADREGFIAGDAKHVSDQQRGEDVEQRCIRRNLLKRGNRLQSPGPLNPQFTHHPLHQCRHQRARSAIELDRFRLPSKFLVPVDFAFPVTRRAALFTLLRHILLKLRQIHELRQLSGQRAPIQFRQSSRNDSRRPGIGDDLMVVQIPAINFVRQLDERGVEEKGRRIQARAAPLLRPLARGIQRRRHI